jgi:protoporphyrinogen oxidase
MKCREIPYNEKLWLCDLDEMTCDWVSWSIPRPALKDVVEGALGISRGSFGYNPSFLYPRRGGIEVLPAALAARVDGLRCGTEVARVDTARRVVHTSAGEELPYDELISTLPLPRLLALSTGLPEAMRDAARALRHTAVVNINFGIDRVANGDMHWVYFPEKEFVFYRAGFPASLAPASAPPGCSSVSLEIAVRPGRSLDAEGAEALCAQARAGLLKAGLMRATDRIVTRAIFRIDPAYVVYDRARQASLPGLLEALRAKGIHSAGRYGAWYYNSMEDSLAEGRDLAHHLLGAGARAKAGEGR